LSIKLIVSKGGICCEAIFKHFYSDFILIKKSLHGASGSLYTCYQSSLTVSYNDESLTSNDLASRHLSPQTISDQKQFSWRLGQAMSWEEIVCGEKDCGE